VSVKLGEREVVDRQPALAAHALRGGEPGSAGSVNRFTVTWVSRQVPQALINNSEPSAGFNL
jgi:hypothetical protein